MSTSTSEERIAGLEEGLLEVLGYLTEVTVLGSQSADRTLDLIKVVLHQQKKIDRLEEAIRLIIDAGLKDSEALGRLTERVELLEVFANSDDEEFIALYERIEALEHSDAHNFALPDEDEVDLGQVAADLFDGTITLDEALAEVKPLLFPEGSDVLWHEGHIVGETRPVFERFESRDPATSTVEEIPAPTERAHDFHVGQTVSVVRDRKAEGVIDAIEGGLIFIEWNKRMPFSVPGRDTIPDNGHNGPDIRSYAPSAVVAR